MICKLNSDVKMKLMVELFYLILKIWLSNQQVYMLLQRFNVSRQESKFFLGKFICNIYESSTLVNLYRKVIFVSGAFQYLLSFKTSWYCLYLTRIFFRCFLNLVYFFTFVFHLTFGAMACW